MTWPQDPLDVKIELYLGSSMGWLDITDYVLVRDGITIRRGWPDEGRAPEPGSMTLTLKNKDGRFTPRNPMGPYYGLIGRNTPIRVSVGGVLPDVEEGFEDTDYDITFTGDGSRSTSNPRTGSGHWQMLANFAGTAEIDVTVPPGATSLTLWYQRTVKNCTFEVLLDDVEVLDTGSGTDGDYVATTHDVTDVSTVTLRLTDSTGGAVNAALNIDDLSFSGIRSIRFVGEVSEWPPRWDVTGNDVRVPLTAQGILRRLGQGSRPLVSPFKQGMLTPLVAGSVEAYWPMEDGTDATQFASGLPGGEPLTYRGERPDFAAVGPVFGSDKLPVLAASTVIQGRVPQLFNGLPQTIRFWFVIDVPPSPSWGDNTSLFRVDQDEGTDGIHAWEVQYFTSSGGALAVAYIGESTAAVTSDLITNINSIGRLWVSVSISQSASTAAISVSAYSLDENGEVDTQGTSTTLGTGSNLVTTPRGFQIGRGGARELCIGHVAFGAVTLAVAFSSTQRRHMLTAFAGESAGARAERLATDSGVPLTMIGDADDTELMGPQAIPSTFFDAFDETWRADMALVYETRHELGLTFRTRRSLYNQPVALALDYAAAGEIAPDLEPIDDDQRVRNDIEVKRKDGSSYRAVDTTSRMGTQDPPDGVGRYDEQITLNLYSDSQLQGQAHWRLHVGTWDEPRIPDLTLDLTAMAAAGKTDLVADAASLDVGDRLQITDMPAYSGFVGTADLMAIGFREYIGVYEWRITV